MFSQHKNDISKISRQISQLRRAGPRVKTAKEGLAESIASPYVNTTSASSVANSAISGVDSAKAGNGASNAAAKSSADSKSKNTPTLTSMDANRHPASTNKIALSNTVDEAIAKLVDQSVEIFEKSSKQTTEISSDNTSMKPFISLRDTNTIESNSMAHSENNTAITKCPNTTSISTPFPVNISQTLTGIGEVCTCGARSRPAIGLVTPANYPIVIDLISKMLLNSLDEISKLRILCASLAPSDHVDAASSIFSADNILMDDLKSFIKNVIQKETAITEPLNSAAIFEIFNSYSYYRLVQDQLASHLLKSTTQVADETRSLYHRDKIVSNELTDSNIASSNLSQIENSLSGNSEHFESDKKYLAGVKESMLDAPGTNFGNEVAESAKDKIESEVFNNSKVNKSNNSQSQSDNDYIDDNKYSELDDSACRSVGDLPIQNKSTHEDLRQPDDLCNINGDKGDVVKDDDMIDDDNNAEEQNEYKGNDEFQVDDEKEEYEVEVDMLYLEVRISEGLVGRIPVHVNSDAKELAIQFVNEHGLESSYIEPLMHYVRQAQDQLVEQLVEAVSAHRSEVVEEDFRSTSELPTYPANIHAEQENRESHVMPPTRIGRRRNVPPPPPPPDPLSTISECTDSDNYNKYRNYRNSDNETHSNLIEGKYSVPNPNLNPNVKIGSGLTQSSSPGLKSSASSQGLAAHNSFYISPNSSLAVSPDGSNSQSAISLSPSPILKSAISPILDLSDRSDSSNNNIKNNNRKSATLSIDELNSPLSPTHRNTSKREGGDKCVSWNNSTGHIDNSELYDLSLSLSPQSVEIESSQRQYSSNTKDYHNRDNQSNVTFINESSSGVYNKAVEIFDQASTLINRGDIVGATPLYEYSLMLFKQSNLSPSKLKVISGEVNYWVAKSQEVKALSASRERERTISKSSPLSPSHSVSNQKGSTHTSVLTQKAGQTKGKNREFLL